MQLFGIFVETETNEIGSFAGREPALAVSDAANARRIAGRHGDSVAECDPGDPDHIADRAVHQQRRAGQAGSTKQSHAAVVMKLHIHFTQPILSGAATRGHDGICYKDGMLQALGAQSHL